MTELLPILSTVSGVGTLCLVAFRFAYNRASARNPVHVDPEMFPDRLHVEPIDTREDYFKLLADYRVVTKVRGTSHAKAGFDTDFLSIPWFARAYLSPNSRYRRAAVQHDDDYWWQRVARALADAAFREGMDSLDSKVTDKWDRMVLGLARRVIHVSLRSCGWVAWRNNGRRRRAEELKEQAV